MAQTVSEETSLKTTSVFQTVSIDSWDSLDKTDFLLTAPVTICVLADLLLCCTKEDVILDISKGHKYEHFDEGSTMKSATAKIVYRVCDSMLTSFESMKNTFGTCEAISGQRSCTAIQTQLILEKVDQADTFLTLFGLYDPAVRNTDYTSAIDTTLQDIRDLVQNVVAAFTKAVSAFESNADVFGDFMQILTVTHNMVEMEGQLLARKETFLDSKEKAAREMQEGAEKHTAELKEAYEQDLARYEKMIEKIPTGSDVMVLNVAEIFLDEVEILGSIGLVWASRNPFGLEKTWKSLSKVIDPATPQSDSDDSPPGPARESAEDLRKRLKELSKLINATHLEVHFLSLKSLIVVKDGKGELKWNDISSVIKAVQPLLQLELELMGPGTEAPPVTEAKASSNNVPPSSPPEDKSGTEQTLDVKVTAWDPNQIRELVREGIQVCTDLDAVAKSHDATRSPAIIETINRLLKTIAKVNRFRDVLIGRLKIPKLSTVADISKKLTSGQGVGDKVQVSAIKGMRASQAVLDTSRVLYEDSLDFMFKSNRDLEDLIGRLAFTQVRNVQFQSLVTSMAAPMAFMGQMDLAFCSTLSLFKALQNVVDVNLLDAFGSIKKPEKGHLRSLTEEKVVEYECRRLFEQVKNLKETIRVMSEVARLYLTVYDDCVKEGITMALDMQKLLVIDDKAEATFIDSHRQKTVTWAKSAQKRVEELLSSERKAKLLAIQQELAAVSPKLISADDVLSDDDIEDIKEFQMSQARGGQMGLKQVERVFTGFTF